MKDRVGATFPARVAGVTRFGLFVALNETGAQGLVPIRSLGSDYFEHDEARRTLTGRKSGEVFALGDKVTATLIDADAVTGSLVFRIDNHEASRPRAASQGGPPIPAHNGRPGVRPGPQQDRRPPNKKFGKRSDPSKKSAGSRGKRGKFKGDEAR
jgi:ribonuclease R